MMAPTFPRLCLNYSSLLSFTHLTELPAKFCDGGCSSTVEDDVITSLARTMPNPQTLYLGGDHAAKSPSA